MEPEEYRLQRMGLSKLEEKDTESIDKSQGEDEKPTYAPGSPTPEDPGIDDFEPEPEKEDEEVYEGGGFMALRMPGARRGLYTYN